MKKSIVKFVAFLAMIAVTTAHAQKGSLNQQLNSCEKELSKPAPMPKNFSEVKVGFSSANDVNLKKTGTRVRTRCFYYSRTGKIEDVGFDTIFELVNKAGKIQLEQTNVGAGGGIVTLYEADNSGRFYHNNVGTNILYARVSQSGDVMMENAMAGVPQSEQEKTFWDHNNNLRQDGIFACRPTTRFQLVPTPTL